MDVSYGFPNPPNINKKFEFADDDLEFELHKLGQEALGAKHAADVVVRRNSLGKAYRSFDNRLTGENVLVDVEPIKSKLDAERRDSIYNAAHVTRSPQLLSSSQAAAHTLAKTKNKHPQQQSQQRSHSQPHPKIFHFSAKQTTTKKKKKKKANQNEALALAKKNDDDDDAIISRPSDLIEQPQRNRRARRAPRETVQSTIQLRSHLRNALPRKDLRKQGKRSDFIWDEQWKINT
jgi:hypothetical protein